MRGPAGSLLALMLVLGCAHGPDLDSGPAPAPASGWQLVTSAHFVVRTDAPRDRYQPVIEHLEDVYQALAGRFFPGLPLPPIDVLLFADQRDFEAVAPDNLLGFFTLRPGSLDDGLLVLSAGGDPAAVQRTAAHELAHRFLHALNERVPRWLHEGFAEYVAALETRDGQVVFDATSASPRRGRPGDPVPLDRLLTAGNGDFYGSNARAVYLTAWLVVRQLLARPDPGSIDRFHRLIARSSLADTAQARAAALSEAFGGTPVARIEVDLRAAREPAAPLSPYALLAQHHRPRWTAAPADSGSIQRLCAELRAQRQF